jgi:hypothetical protein
VGGTFQGGTSHEGREFFMKGEPNLPALFEKQEIRYKKKQVFQLKVRRNIKT